MRTAELRVISDPNETAAFVDWTAYTCECRTEASGIKISIIFLSPFVAVCNGTKKLRGEDFPKALLGVKIAYMPSDSIFFYSVAPSKCRATCTSIKGRQVPSKSFRIHHIPAILPRYCIARGTDSVAK
jgi:hypothetical protein